MMIAIRRHDCGLRFLPAVGTSGGESVRRDDRRRWRVGLIFVLFLIRSRRQGRQNLFLQAASGQEGQSLRLHLAVEVDGDSDVFLLFVVFVDVAVLPPEVLLDL